MLPIQFLQAHSKNYTKGRTGKIEWIVVHYTANSNDTAKGNCNYFSKEVSAHTSAHYFVDENSIWQSVKDTDTAHAVGGAKHYYNSCRNANSIHIEMCNSVNSVPLKTRANTITMVKYLMDKYNIDINHVVRHYDVTGKVCPKPYVNNVAAWNNFKSELEDDMTEAEVRKIIESYLTELGDKAPATWIKTDKVMENGKTAGITDGTKPMALASRAEVVAMILRALKK